MKKLGLTLSALVILFGFNGCYEQESSQSSSSSTQTSESKEAEAPGEWPPGLGEVEVDFEQNMLKRNYYVIFDGSGSMRGNKIEVAKRAIKEFVNHVPPEANLGLFVFDTAGASERAPLGSSQKAIIEEIDRVVANRSTPLTAAIRYSYEMLSIQGLRQLGYGEYNMVVVTDGVADYGPQLSSMIDRILEESPIIIHTIGYQIKGGHTLNQPDKVYYRSAESFEQLSEGLQEVLAEAEDFSVDEFQSED